MKVLIAGDFAPRVELAKKIESRRFSEVFPKDLRMVIKSADFSFVNFESPVVEEDYKPISKCGPNLCCTHDAVDAIKYAGFTGVTMANNHILDYGVEGLYKSIEYSRKQGLYVVGVGRNLIDTDEILYLEKGGKKLAVINCCEQEFSIATDKGAGANPLNPIRQFYAIQKAKQKADYVLMIVHGGHEHYQLPSIRMQETYRFFIDVGVDAVVNHHQHCYSGYELYCGKPIFYGLGNFCFDASGNLPDSWYNGYLVEFDFHKEKVNYMFYPYVQCKENVRISLLYDRTEFDKSIAMLNAIIADSQKLQKANEEYYSTNVKNFKTMYQPYENRILNKLYRMHLLPSLVSQKKFLQILNYISCEAHRDKQLFSLKILVEK